MAPKARQDSFLGKVCDDIVDFKAVVYCLQVIQQRSQEFFSLQLILVQL